MTRYSTFIVSGEEYKMRLTSATIVKIEKKLGKPFFEILEKLQDNLIENLVTVFWGAMQTFDKNITIEQVYDLYDAFIDEGNSLEDIINSMTDLFEASGFFKKGQEKSLA